MGALDDFQFSTGSTPVKPPVKKSVSALDDFQFSTPVTKPSLVSRAGAFATKAVKKVSPVLSFIDKISSFDPAKIVGKTLGSSVGKSVTGAREHIRTTDETLKNLPKNAPRSEKVAAHLKSGAAMAGLLFSPATGVFQGIAELGPSKETQKRINPIGSRIGEAIDRAPVSDKIKPIIEPLKKMAKSIANFGSGGVSDVGHIVNASFEVKGALGAEIAHQALNHLPISEKAKENLRPAIEEWGNLIGQGIHAKGILDVVTKPLPAKIDAKIPIARGTKVVPTMETFQKTLESERAVKKAGKEFLDKMTDSTPKLPASKGELSVRGEGFTMTDKPSTTGVAISKALAEMRSATAKHNAKPTPTTLKTVQKAREAVRTLLEEPAVEIPAPTPKIPTQPKAESIKLFRGSEGKVKSIERTFKNPLEESGDQFTLAKRLRSEGVDLPEPKNKNYTEVDPAILKWARKEGHDGLIFKNEGRTGSKPFIEILDVKSGRWYSPDRSVAQANSRRGMVTKPVVRETPVKKEIPQTKPSGVARQIEAKAIEKGMIDKGYEELAGYDSSTIKAQAELGSKYTQEQINDIAIGKEPLPSGMKPGTALSIAEDYAMKNRDGTLIAKLAKSPLATELSESASALSLSRMRTPDSATAKIKEVMRERNRVAESKLKGKSVVKVKAEIRKQVEGAIKKSKPTPKDWKDFIQSITC